ncbi:MAG TPA: hypothetical protein VGF84_15685 [Micromonosporaceae bacterium]|jgi:hypothetical protein
MSDTAVLARPRPTRSPLTGLACVVAPALIIAYGVARLIDGLDGTHGPGPAWTIGHLFFLAGLLLFGVAMIGLRNRVERGRIVATVAATAGLVGLVAFVRTTLIDLIVGFQGVDRAGMNRIYPRYDGWPGGLPTGLTDALGNVGPALFLLGLLTLTILLVAARPAMWSWWSPVLVAIGFAAISVNLDLLPVGGAALLLALLPAYRRTAPTS